MIENHPFKAFVPNPSEVLILGSFPGKESTQVKRDGDWFYGANRNQFWKIIELVYNLKLNSKAKKQELFTGNRIAITDIISSCERAQNSNLDNNLVNIVYNNEISSIIKEQGIKKVLFTSKNVCDEYFKHYEKVDGVDFIVLPSPSPIYRRISMQEKAIEYSRHLPKHDSKQSNRSRILRWYFYLLSKFGNIMSGNKIDRKDYTVKLF